MQQYFIIPHSLLTCSTVQKNAVIQALYICDEGWGCDAFPV